MPDLSLVGDFSLFGGFERIGVLAALLHRLHAACWPTSSTPWAPSSRSAPRPACSTSTATRRTSQQVLLVDSLAAAAGGAASASSATSYVESTAGVADGARTGLASVVTGLLFVLALFFTPAGLARPVRGGHPGAGDRRLPADHAGARPRPAPTSAW